MTFLVGIVRRSGWFTEGRRMRELPWEELKSMSGNLGLLPTFVHL